MIPALVRRGFGYGSGMIDPTQQRFLLNMPKNASSYMSDWTYRHGWRAALLENCPKVNEVIVILRDPVDRWISGICQYLRTYILSVQGPNGPIFPTDPVTCYDYAMSGQDFCRLYNDLTERLIFDVIDMFDDHVWPQHALMPPLPQTIIKTYFFLDHDLTTRVAQYLGLQVVPDLDFNRGDANADTAAMQSFLRERLQVRPELRDRLRKHYQQDYDLLTKAHHVQ
jgi:hypothetical protein